MTPAELTAARHALGLTKTALAHLLGVTFETVWRWETDTKSKRQIPPTAAAYLRHLLEEHHQP